MSRPVAFEVRRLRALAQWHRGGPKIQSVAERQERIKYAALLERLAADYERRAASNGKAR